MTITPRIENAQVLYVNECASRVGDEISAGCRKPLGHYISSIRLVENRRNGPSAATAVFVFDETSQDTGKELLCPEGEMN